MLNRNLQHPNTVSLFNLDWVRREMRKERKKGMRGQTERMDKWWQMAEGVAASKEKRWWRHVCVPVGPVCLRGLVLGGGWQGWIVLVCMRECVRVWVRVWVRVRVCVGGRVGGTGGALWRRVVGVGGGRAAVVQTVEFIHFLICRLWTMTKRHRQLCSVNMSHARLSDSPPSSGL